MKCVSRYPETKIQLEKLMVLLNIKTNNAFKIQFYKIHKKICFFPCITSNTLVEKIHRTDNFQHDILVCITETTRNIKINDSSLKSPIILPVHIWVIELSLYFTHILPGPWGTKKHFQKHRIKVMIGLKFIQFWVCFQLELLWAF